MQGRIAQGPYVALGVAEDASMEEVRGAFLALTKRYHPARFGRMSTDVQKLSNEVFLGIKSAHDQLMRATGGARSSNALPVMITAESSSAHRAVAVPSSKTPSGQVPVLPRTLTPMRGTEPPANRPITPTHGRTPTPMPQRPATPPQQQRPGTPPERKTGGFPQIDPGTQPGVATNRSTQRTAPVYDEQVAFQTVLDLMKKADYRGAREAMHALAARVPQNKQYRAYLCYVRGREAHVGGHFDEAAMEYQRALQLDPELVPAKQALVDAQRKR